MARKTKADAAITREQLLDAAERVFRERGVTRTSLAEIAAEAGVTRGAVYWHFRDKADLFAAMCQRATSPMDTMVERAHAARQASPLATLRSLCIEALEHLAADPRAQAVFEIIFHKSELAGELAGVGERHDRDCRDCRTRLQAVVERAIVAGELPADTDAALATHALNAYFTGLMHEWTLDPSAYDLKRSAPAFIDTFLAGLVACPPRRAKAPLAEARAEPARTLAARG
jgi:TetR/AcrR family acrAB operon transcriptional repressor